MGSGPIHLTLMVGPVVPVPVPKEVLDALTRVQVTTTAGKASGFQLTFKLTHDSPLHTLFLVSAGLPLKVIRVIIAVTVNGTPEVLMDGVMRQHEVTPSSKPGQSTLTVTGDDLTAVMDLIEFTGFPYPAMPPSARVVAILAKYAMFGMLPKVIPSVLFEVPNPLETIPRHKGTDLQYIKHLADQVGYVFYLEPGPSPGTNVAYWGPEIKVGQPQPALNLDMDAHTNVESLNFRYDSQAKTLPVVHIHNKLTKVPIPIPLPDVNPLSPPLGAVPALPQKIRFIGGTAKMTPTQAIIVGLAKAAQTSDVVTGMGSLDVLRYGRVLKARQLVGVRGAGMAFDGLYYVKSVTHSLKRGEYKQNFTLARNGLISTVPQVRA